MDTFESKQAIVNFLNIQQFEMKNMNFGHYTLDNLLPLLPIGNIFCGK